TIGADYHYFALNSDMKKADGTLVGRDLGTELDLVLNYNMNKFTNIEVGYCTMWAKSNMAFAKGQATTDAAASTFRKDANWFYLMLKFTPDFMYTKPVAIKQP
ncbi:MAG: hypothetical protein HY305_02560, partial [Sphingobacteriales bacterium]|nr:hypothetical protein [Sphingobacteriales bacterium]